MKKLAYTFLITGAIVLAFGLLAWIIPGITITQFVLGFCFGIGSTLILGGLVFLASPVFCRKKKEGAK
jgi:hypothetical protein